MKNHYKRPSPPDLGWDGLHPDFRSFDGNNIETWNIDGCSEGQMMIIFQEMFIAATSYLRIMSQREVVDALTAGFTENLRSWWHNHLIDANREAIKDGRTILYSDQSMKALLGKKCPKMSDFKWYKDTFMSRLYNLTTCRDIVWKHKYVEELPKYVRERFYSTMVTDSGGTDIDWEGISYGDINFTIQKVCLEICQQQKHAIRLQRTQIIGENWDLSASNMELTTLLLLGRRFDPRKSSEGVKRVNHMSTLTVRGGTMAKVVKAEELSFEGEEFSFEKEEDLPNAVLEESSEESSLSKNESDNEASIPCSGCINVLTST
ncbi:hypothetical protein E5676_scaffold546G001830 [Cucumis melo var. makuwa]|uniref:DUF7746 domain-containing protein n=1 Tax=Cucumis melo var. makuwa TaxID=1194695 RepID=A0A5A7VJD6_CUCMM|nr:hypothetical protein E6C27_scaffold37G00880 [Cucumis melo var. makuwa]TYJ96530.1 hypothetical protein E5676_scaffold546G001830 [Cucumis melo var. makuwa]